jgi:hypothetical protein
VNIYKIQRFLSLLIVVIAVSACSIPADTAPAQTPIASADIADINAKYRQEIPRLMQQENIPGLAIAVVDDQGILWAEGFGFLSDQWWLPELKVGIALLTNSSDHELHSSLALQILDDLVHQPGTYYDRLMALPYKSRVTEGDDHWQPPATLTADIATRALPPNPAGWQSCLGEYKSINFGGLIPPTTPNRVYEQDGTLYFDGTDVGDAAQLRLFETAPGLFFTETGEALDFRITPPIYRNIQLRQVGAGPSLVAWGILVACGLVMLSALLALPARPIWRRLRRQGTETRSPAPRSAAAATNGLAVVGSLCGLASIGLLAAIPRLIYSGFLGWLALPMWQKLLLHAPLGLALCTVALAVLAILAWQRNWWRLGQRWHYTGLVVAALAETAMFAGWHLIGLGL